MKIMKAIEKFIKAVSIFDGYLIIAMMLMIGIDIVLRLFGGGIKGSVEIVTACVPVIVFLGVGYTALQEMHIRVDVVKWHHLDRLMNLICIVALAIVGYYAVLQSLQVKALGTSSTLLSIPRWPIVMVTAFGMFLVAIALILNEIKAYIELFSKKKSSEETAPAESDTEFEAK
jgi:TRAP-type C4-dicarboxylate transport system permease small subunit